MIYVRANSPVKSIEPLKDTALLFAPTSRGLSVQATSTLGRKARLPGIDVSLVLVVQTASSLGTALVLIYCFQVFMSLFFLYFVS